MIRTMRKHVRQYLGPISAAATLLLLLVLMSSAKQTGIMSNGYLDELEEKLNNYNSNFPEDRVYLQTDKPFYKPGEDVWFSAFVRNGSDFKPSEKSEILYAELINPKGNVEKTIKLIARNGKSNGDFHIDSSMPGGIYKIKAYTNWQKNEKDPHFFEKELTVQKVVLPRLKMKLDFVKKAYGPGDEVTAELDLQTNENKPLTEHDFNFTASLYGQQIAKGASVTTESGKAFVKFELPKKLESNDGVVNIMIQYNGLTESISRSIPIVLNDIKVEVFPEGGDLVDGLRSRVAVRARNEFGKPADISGSVYEKGTENLITTFSSFHDGMGSFYMTPESGTEYEIRLTKPAGTNIKVDLPEAMSAGYTLEVEDIQSNGIIVNARSTEDEELGVVATVRGKMYYKHAFDAKEGDNRMRIPIDKFPIGVTQITLFDSKGIERAERLAFVNPNKQLKIEIETDKEKYLPREKVNMTVKVTDERGVPMPANLSLSVTNDQLLAFADDKQGHIMAQLLLQPDLSEKVEEPNFYFDKKEEKATAALDLLMMTSGWRRFTWKEIEDGKMPTISHASEMASVGGIVMDGYKQKPLAGAIVATQDGSKSVYTDKDGRFRFKDLDVVSPMYLKVTKDGFSQQNLYVSQYSNSFTTYLYDHTAYRQENKRVARGNNFNFFGGAAGKQKALAAPRMANGGAAFRMDAVPAPAPKADFNGIFGDDGAANNAAIVEDLEDEKMAMDPVAADQPVPVREPVSKLEKEGKEEDKRLEAANEQIAIDDDIDNLVANGEIVEMDEEVAAFAWQWDGGKDRNRQQAAPVFYRARQFPTVEYATSSGGAPNQTIVRNDFRSTIYWNPNLVVDRSGKAEFSFYNSDEITSFRTVVEGIAEDGMIGRAEYTHFTQLPFTLNARIPIAAATADKVIIPVTLKNNTEAALSGKLGVITSAALKPVTEFNPSLSIEPGQAKTLYLAFKVQDMPGEQSFKLNFETQGLRDGMSKLITVAPKGFPVSLSMAGKKKAEKFSFNIANLVNGSLTAKVTAYPSVVSDLLTGIESILREPYGCFEQTSTSSYPNLLVMKYLKSQENPDPAVYGRAETLLNKGYNRLTTYETSQKGYEWFGSAPGHEALTAYGLLQFNDMKNVSDKVDQKMIDRTAQWLLSRRDGKGGFKRDPKALDSFGRALPEITNAYIVWALAEAGYRNIDKEMTAAYNDALKTKDAYRLALVTNALYAMDDKARGKKALEALMATQNDDGSFTGTKHSITVSGGQSFTIETTSLAISAMIKADGDLGKMTKAVQSIVSKRSGHGAFGSTQGTILALRALTEYAQHTKRTEEDGTLEVYVDGKKVGTHKYEKGDRGAIEIDGLEKHMGSGKHNIEVKFVGVQNPLPYSVAVDYTTTLPNSQAECKVKLNTKLATKKAKMGETIRLTAELENTTKDGLPMTMAVLGLPAGTSAQPWQLKEMQEKGVFDFYEIRDNNLICYYRQMKPSEKREINLDLKAEVPGIYDAPASAAYLYYTPEHKNWSSVDQLAISQ